MLDENFSVVANRFPKDDKTAVLIKENYITQLKVGEIGGEKRAVIIKSIDINNNIATAKIEFESDDTIFAAYQSFILNSNNVW